MESRAILSCSGGRFFLLAKGLAISAWALPGPWHDSQVTPARDLIRGGLESRGIPESRDVALQARGIRLAGGRQDLKALTCLSCCFFQSWYFSKWQEPHLVVPM